MNVMKMIMARKMVLLAIVVAVVVVVVVMQRRMQTEKFAENVDENTDIDVLLQKSDELVETATKSIEKAEELSNKAIVLAAEDPANADLVKAAENMTYKAYSVATPALVTGAFISKNATDKNKLPTIQEEEPVLKIEDADKQQMVADVLPELKMEATPSETNVFGVDNAKIRHMLSNIQWDLPLEVEEGKRGMLEPAGIQ